jgi:hypothetical protein
MLADDGPEDRAPVWTITDRLMIQAVLAFEASLCDGCKQPRHRSMNHEMAGRYQIHAHTCYACGPLQDAQKGQTQTAGVKQYVVDAGPPDDDLTPWAPRLVPIDQDKYDELMGGS